MTPNHVKHSDFQIMQCLQNHAQKCKKKKYLKIGKKNSFNKFSPIPKPLKYFVESLKGHFHILHPRGTKN